MEVDRIHRKIIYGEVKPKVIRELAFSHNNYTIENLNLLIADTRNRPFLTSKIKGLHLEV